jgi:lysophospholipase L1-like esterase
MSDSYRVDVIEAMFLGMSGTLDPDDATYPWRFLAEGDSWFTIGAVPSSNLLYEMSLDRPALVLNLGYPGDTLAHISNLSSNLELSRRLADPNWESDWTGILLSAGGNDLISRVDKLLRIKPLNQGANPEDYLDMEVMAALEKTIGEGMRRIVELRDSSALNAGKPIIVHTYDFPMPRPAPARFLLVPAVGPSLYPDFKARKVPDELWMPVTEAMFKAYARIWARLAATLPALHMVNTQGTLTSAEPGSQGNSGDWLNEIHPNSDGYRKLARKIARKINDLNRRELLPLARHVPVRRKRGARGARAVA